MAEEFPAWSILQFSKDDIQATFEEMKTRLSGVEQLPKGHA